MLLHGVKTVVPELCRMVIGKINFISSLFYKTLQLCYLEFAQFDFAKEGNRKEVMGVDIGKLLKKLKNQIPAIHDLKLQTESNLHQYLIGLGYEANKHNKCVLLTVTTSPNVWAKMVVYPSLIQVDVACSQEPFKCNVEGMDNLTALLEQIRHFLLQKTDYTAQIPEIGTWRFDHCHFNIDGENITLSGKDFNITFESAVGEFKRVYSKKMDNGRNVIRLEQILIPKKPLSEVIQELLHQEIKMI